MILKNHYIIQGGKKQEKTHAVVLKLSLGKRAFPHDFCVMVSLENWMRVINLCLQNV